jgi:hypothetical protein
MSYEWDFVTAMLGMDVGDSFFVPCLKCGPIKRQINAAAASLQIEVEITHTVEDELQGLRCVKVMR